MSDTSEKTGACLCGAVRFTVRDAKHDIGVCHCSMCRRWSGGPLFALDCGSDVSFEGAENISRYHSSEWGERGFCKHCGSNLFYRLVQSGQYVMAVGAFHDQSDFKLTDQIFIDDKPGYYDFANQTRMMSGAEVFAQYAPKPPEGERD